MPSVTVPTAVAAGADVAAASAATAGAGAAVTAGVGAADITAGMAGLATSVATPLTFAAGAGIGFGTAAQIASGVAAVGSAYGQHKAGIAQKNEADMKARQAGLEAGQKQIQIRQNMLRALASQNAAAGAGGIGTGGSFGANVNRQITQNQNDLMALSADTSAQQSLYAQQGSNAARGGNVAAGASLLDYAGSKNGPILGNG